MTSRERFKAVLSLQLPDDRLPMIEWASWWWDRTIVEWQKQGLPATLGFHDVAPYLGLDQHYQFWLPHKTADCPQPAFNGGPIMEGEEGYEEILPYLYPEHGTDGQLEMMKALKPRHDAGEFPIWFSLGIAAIAVIISIYAVMWSLVLALYAVDLAFAVSAIGCFIYGFMGFSWFSGLFCAGTGIFLAGAAAMLFVGCIVFTKFMVRMTKSVCIGIKNLFIKK